MLCTGVCVRLCNSSVDDVPDETFSNFSYYKISYFICYCYWRDNFPLADSSRKFFCGNFVVVLRLKFCFFRFLIFPSRRNVHFALISNYCVCRIFQPLLALLENMEQHTKSMYSRVFFFGNIFLLFRNSSPRCNVRLSTIDYNRKRIKNLEFQRTCWSVIDYVMLNRFLSQMVCGKVCSQIKQDRTIHSVSIRMVATGQPHTKTNILHIHTIECESSETATYQQWTAQAFIPFIE